MRGQYEFDTAGSEAMSAMEARPEKKYRALTRAEIAAVVRKQQRAQSVDQQDVCAICRMSLVDLEEIKQPTSPGSIGGGIGGGGGGSVAAHTGVGQEREDGPEEEGKESSAGVAASAIDLVRPLNCEHVLHAPCMQSLLESRSPASTLCPECRAPFTSGVRFGSGPQGTLVVTHVGLPLPGFPTEGTIQMDVHFRSGIQGPRHPAPGSPYVAHGFPRSFFMPESQAALAFRLQLAFYWRLIFKIGTSQTTHAPDAVVWTGAVSVRSNFESGQPRSFSEAPQENRDYFERLSRDLDAVGITASFAELTRKHLRSPLV